MEVEKRWLKALEVRRDQSLLRHRLQVDSPPGERLSSGGRDYLCFASNDYLGLANDDLVKQAAIEAISRYGVGSGASHMVTGHHREHDLLEQALAEFTGRDRALVFSTGYMANMAVISALSGRKDAVFEDRLNHASLIDGGLLSGARFQRYLHADCDSLKAALARFESKPDNQDALKLVVTDGVFSMDGNMAPLPGLVEICEQHEAVLMVDDAHGLGVFGTSGGGCIEHFKLQQNQVPILVGTFGKAFGTAGAFVAGSETLIRYIEQFARPYIYTTAMPPAMAAATRQALKIIVESDDRRARLRDNITSFRSAMKRHDIALMASDSPIQPLLVGDNDTLMRLNAFLMEQGILVGAIRPPTVPDGSARLRITLSSSHGSESLDQLVNTLARAKDRSLL